MGERKGQNKYYPPDFDPKKQHGRQAYYGLDFFGEKEPDVGNKVRTIRFEMPFNCWCLTCKTPIGMGVRYNAEKSKIGMFHSTPIFQFNFNCAICAGTIIMKTDPENFDYVFVEGARRKVESWDAEANEQIVLASNEEKRKLALDPMYLIEHDVKDKIKGDEMKPVIEQLEIDRLQYQDEFRLNQLARNKFRAEKQEIKFNESQDDNLMKKSSLKGSSISLLPETAEDRDRAKILTLRRTKPLVKMDAKQLIQGVLKRNHDPLLMKNSLKLNRSMSKQVKLLKSAVSLTPEKMSTSDSSSVKSSLSPEGKFSKSSLVAYDDSDGSI